MLRQLARPPQTPKTPHEVDHLEREVEKRQAVESELSAAQKARKDAEADLDDALRRVDVLEAEAAALRRKCDDQAHDLSYARETGASAAQGSDARIAQLERELAAARAHNEEAARAHARTRRPRTTRPGRPSRSSRRPSRASASIWWTRGRRPRRSLCWL